MTKHNPDCGCADCSVVVEPDPPAPTADEVREARMAITAHFNHTEPCRTLEAHVHTILTALDQAQEEVERLTRSVNNARVIGVMGYDTNRIMENVLP